MIIKDASFASFAVKDIKKAHDFYSQTLGLDVKEADEMGLLHIAVGSGKEVMVYPKDDHQPANYTVFNLIADDLDKTVAELADKGVTFDKYEGFDHEESGIVRAYGQGPDIAWFKDPSGNIIAVMTQA